MYNKIKIFFLLTIIATKVSAQIKSSDADTIMLNEVTIKASSVIQKVDRKVLIPSVTQIKASNNGVTLLKNMQLPRIIVNPVSNAITTPDGSSVQLRINGIEVTAAEIVAIQPQDIIRIEYHEEPGMRYGNAAAVIDYITRRRESGGNLSTNLMNALWRLGFADDYLSAKVNHNKSEFGVNAYFHYRNINWTRENYQTFVFPTMEIRQSEIGKPTKFIEKFLNIAANYNLNEPDKYLFNVTFRNNNNNTPNSFTNRISALYSSADSVPASISDHSTWWNNTPSLDIYFQRNMKHDQLIILNVVGTYMNSKSTRLYRQEQTGKDLFTSYSCITGDKYSLIAEGIYEKKIKNGTLTAGIRHAQSYTENNYSGNVTSDVGLAVEESNVYTEYKFRKDKFSYTFGVGVKRTFYSQDETNMENYTLRPQLGIVYNINNSAYVRYFGYITAYPPSLSDLNNVTQNIDILQVQQGNPNLKTVWFNTNSINAGYNKGIIGMELYLNYRYNHNPIMEQVIFADNLFVHTNFNQKAFHRFISQMTFKLKPWKNYITLTSKPAFTRYISKGNSYLHTCNDWHFHNSLLATYKNWSLNGEWYTRRNGFWGETFERGERMINFMIGYNTPKWTVGVMVANPFSGEYSQGNVNYSALTPYNSNLYTRNLGQVIIFNFSMNLNFGHKYNAGNKRLDNSDTDAGIMTGTKK